MQNLLNVHSRFLRDVIIAAKIDPNSKISAIPTILFLPGTFLLIYSYFHRLASNYRTPKAALYRECGFHWVFFYVTRVWFLMIKGSRYVVKFLEEYLKLSQMLGDDCRFCISPHFARGIVFSVFLIVSLIPIMILCIKFFYREHIPNFLMWVAEDPWMRSEIGLSGHYLERPPPFVLPVRQKKRRYHQGLRRSTSADFVTMKGSAGVIRTSKSVQYPSGSSFSF